MFRTLTSIMLFVLMIIGTGEVIAEVFSCSIGLAYLLGLVLLLVVFQGYKR